jgi:uncharacterized membrane protein
MPSKLIGFAIISFLHDLFTVIWMGGMMVTLFAYTPAVKEALGAGPQMKKVMGAFKKKQRIWVWVSMAGLIITGILMSRRSPDFVQWFSFSNPYSIALSIKHIIVIVMVGIALYRSIVLVPKAMPMAGPDGALGPGGKQPGAKQPGGKPGMKPGMQPGGPQSAAAAKQAKLNFILLVINVILAVLVLFNSAVVSALAMPLPGK